MDWQVMKDSWQLLIQAQDELETARKDLMRAVSSYMQDPDWVRWDFACEAAGRYAYWLAAVAQLRSDVEREANRDKEASTLPF